MENELKDLDKIIAELIRGYPTLMDLMATDAVNFTKERFVKGLDINEQPLKPRKKVKGKKDDKGWAIGVKTRALQRDFRKISVTQTHAILGTTSITGHYAKPFNEGF